MRINNIQKVNSIQHDYKNLMQLFDDCFFDKFNTKLVKGQTEPLYIPAGHKVDNYAMQAWHQILFAHGFFRSALHEVAHWLVAGDARRLKVDYGYWYQTDGRSANEQALFEQVEVKPQAIEWILTKACRHTFRVSVDNLNGQATDPMPFKQAVYQRVLALQAEGLNERAECFRLALAQFYGTTLNFQQMHFTLEEL